MGGSEMNNTRGLAGNFIVESLQKRRPHFLRYCQKAQLTVIVSLSPQTKFASPQLAASDGEFVTKLPPRGLSRSVRQTTAFNVFRILLSIESGPDKAQ